MLSCARRQPVVVWMDRLASKFLPQSKCVFSKPASKYSYPLQDGAQVARPFWDLPLNCLLIKKTQKMHAIWSDYKISLVITATALIPINDSKLWALLLCSGVKGLAPNKGVKILRLWVGMGGCPCGSTRNFVWAQYGKHPIYKYKFIGYGIFSSNNKYKSISKRRHSLC